MTNKFREKFFFSILTSIATMLVIFLLPLVFGDSHISSWYFEKVSSVLITTNMLEGYNSKLKRALQNHNGLNEANRKKFIDGFLNITK